MPAAPTLPFSPNAQPLKILTEEERHNIAEGRKMADQVRAAEGKAKFKIELLATASWSTTKPVPGILSFWESGSQLHGGGDTILHFCPGRKLKKNDCEHYIPDPSHGYGFLVCPGCNNVWNGKDVWGQVIGRHMVQQWAELITQYYVRLDMNADIVIKHHKEDIRKASVGVLAQDKLESVRSSGKRRRRIYKLDSIIRDTSAGSDLYTRILAFVRA